MDEFCLLGKQISIAGFYAHSVELIFLSHLAKFVDAASRKIDLTQA